jgi:hypothetical protein
MGSSITPSEQVDSFLLPEDWSVLEKRTPAVEKAEHRLVRQKAILERVKEFNRDAQAIATRRLVTIQTSKRQLVAPQEESDLPSLAKATLDHYAVADALAIYYRDKTRRAFRHLFILAFGAMVILEFIAHAPVPREQFLPVRPWLFILYPAVWGAAFLYWRSVKRQEYESKYQDYRALAEGLRVQFFWCVLGLPEAVEDHYLTKQRNELEWIRYALHAWRIHDEKLLGSAAACGQPSNEGLARRRWIAAQLDYFNDAGPWHKQRGESLRGLGEKLFLVSVGIAIFLWIMLVIQAALHRYGKTPYDEFWAEAPWFLLIGIAIVGAALLLAYAEKLAFAEHAKQYDAIAQRFKNTRERLETSGKLTDDTTRALYLELGREALSESGDWLLIHRERPLEVPIP